MRFVHGMFTTASTGQLLHSDDIEDTGRILRSYMIPSMPHAATAAAGNVPACFIQCRYAVKSVQKGRGG